MACLRIILLGYVCAPKEGMTDVGRSEDYYLFILFVMQNDMKKLLYQYTEIDNSVQKFQKSQKC